MTCSFSRPGKKCRTDFSQSDTDFSQSDISSFPVFGDPCYLSDSPSEINLHSPLASSSWFTFIGGGTRTGGGMCDCVFMLFIYFLLAVLHLPHCMGFPLVAESRGSSLSCGAWAARRGGYHFAERRLRGA